MVALDASSAISHCVASGRAGSLLMLSFLRLQNGNDNSTYLTGLNELGNAKLLKVGPDCSKGFLVSISCYVESVLFFTVFLFLRMTCEKRTSAA